MHATQNDIGSAIDRTLGKAYQCVMVVPVLASQYEWSSGRASGAWGVDLSIFVSLQLKAGITEPSTSDSESYIKTPSINRQIIVDPLSLNSFDSCKCPFCSIWRKRFYK